ncbi:MAG: S9 family peptidase [Candidatus Aminicenantes bacterium]|nr:S9 family peptidase [Candidatus Aminicenantes bacterium]
MKRRPLSVSAVLVLSLSLFILPSLLSAQVTKADYDRAFGLREKLQSLAVDLPERPSFIGTTPRFWYRKTVSGGSAFVLMDAATLEKKPAFDHARLAAALAKAVGEAVEPFKLPFNTITFVDGEKAVEFAARDNRWKCDLSTYDLTKLGPVERGSRDPWSMWVRGPAPEAASANVKTSPDGAREAFIRNYNVWVRTKDKKEEFPLSWDGSEGDYYTYASLAWSPDSKKIAAYRLRRGYHRLVNYVESSPADQLQPKFRQMEYAKPGDALDISVPVLFHVDPKARIDLDNRLFANPYDMSGLAWRKDGRAFTFEYNQRGHQVYRVIEVDGTTGRVRALISEEPKTFFHYSGKKYRYDVDDGREIIWMSERDGWNHLYLYDGLTGQVKNRITEGEWVVRGVERVDAAKREIWIQAGGMNPGIDPYFVHYYKVDFDGTGLAPVTEGNATHNLVFSSDYSYFLDTSSRVDRPTVMELRRTSDLKVLTEVEKTDVSGLVKAGWKAPEVFVAKGRDGKTDIWGVIFRPTRLDPRKKYPVVESIYAGPHGSFVPKTFSPYNGMQSLAELGFIVVQIDGMGTSNRSKSFHDVAWKNIGDAGFPDRILWHKAVAAKYPWYDITRVGIYGTSAGGQNALGALLFHPEFYDAAVSACGCHDNRMDKIWWNEQWMGWPIGPEYASSSNVDNAHRLQGKLLLVLGEMDTNVDPSSTMQVVNALIKAGKMFDLLVIPGGGHGSGGAYGDKKRYDFFVRNLLGLEPPDWNKDEPKK